jgi:SAM-dependent methyltransferase
VSTEAWIQALADSRAGDHPEPETLKACCADVYASEWARLLLGDSFHPGGMQLTDRLAGMLSLRPGDRVLDLACGAGASAIHLAERFGIEPVGIDFSSATVDRARAAAVTAGIAAEFVVGDAEHLDFEDGSFDVVICECSFCVFPDKAAVSSEIARVLRPGGRVGIGDVCREGDLPPELDTLLAWVACISDAWSARDIAGALAAAGLCATGEERHDDALASLIRDIGGRLMVIEAGVQLGRLTLPPGVELDEARRVRRAAADAVQRGVLGYALVTARKP